MEQLNDTALALVLTFIPGIVCYGVVAALAVQRRRDNTILVLQVFMYGVASYILIAAVCLAVPKWATLLHVNPDNIPLLNPSALDKSIIDPITIGSASAIALCLGLIISFNINTSLLMRLCRWVRLTNRFSDPDVWSFVLNSEDINNWAIIRLPDKGLIYQGYLRAFSSGENDRELVLTQVKVFDFDTAAPVGEIPILYLSLNKEALLIELSPTNLSKVKKRRRFSFVFRRFIIYFIWRKA